MAEQRANSLLDRIGGPYAVTLRGLLVILLPSILPNVVYDSVTSGGSPLAWGLVGLAGTGVGGVVYLILGAIFLPQRPRRSRPVTAFIVFGLAGVTRGAVIAYLSFSTGLAAQPLWTFRIVGATVLGICWFALAAIIVDAWSRNQVVINELQARQQSASIQRAQAEATLRQARESINDALLSRMITITSTLASVAQHGSDPLVARRVASEMHATVKDVVRPLSHTLALTTPIVVQVGAPVESLGQRSRRWLRSVTRDALTIDPYHPMITALVVTPSAIPGAIRAYGVVPGLFGAATIGAFTWVILNSARTLHARRTAPLGRWSWLPAVITYLLVGAACSLVPVAAQLIRGGTGIEGWTSGGQVLFILTPIAALGAAVVAAEDRRRTLGERELQAAVTQAEWSTHRVQQEAWAANRLLARELHGGVQSELTAAALRLEAWSRNPDPQTLDAVLDQVRLAVDRVNDLMSRGVEPPPVDVHRALDSICDVWISLARVDIDLDPDVALALEQDQAAAVTVIEVVRECLGNSIRHGRASQVSIEVAFLAEGAAAGDAVALTVTDNGVGTGSATIPGLGSHILDQLCLRWTRAQTRPGTRVEAVVPLASEPPTAHVDSFSA
jgi:signal transduction histidine kinase